MTISLGGLHLRKPKVGNTKDVVSDKGWRVGRGEESVLCVYRFVEGRCVLDSY